MITWYTLYKQIQMFAPSSHFFVTYEVVTSLCSVLYAHGGCKLRLVLIMDQPHLRNPFQIVCGVDLHTDRMTMTSMQMVWKHDVHVADENAWTKYNEKTKLKVKLHSQLCWVWASEWHDSWWQAHEAHDDAHWQLGNTHTHTCTNTRAQTHTHIDTHWVSSWPPGHFLWPWCQTGVPGSPWPWGCHGQQGPRPAGRCWCRLSRGGRLSLTVDHAATAPRCHFQTGLGWMPVTERRRTQCRQTVVQIFLKDVKIIAIFLKE